MNNEPLWKAHKREYNREYNKNNKVQIAIKLNKATEPELIEIYQAIPNKAEWFKDSLRRYAKEHPEIYTNREDPEFPE